MSWEKLLTDKRLKVHKASLEEIAQLRAVVDRDMSDAQVAGLSTDRKFACLYSAALQLASMVIACSGYRVSAISGHHKITFEAMRLAMGEIVEPYVVYFDVCRRKRNAVEYDGSLIATDTEVSELKSKVVEFQMIVLLWIQQNYPEMTGD